jgi:predicted ATP-binding protein involved in virulence
MKLVRFTASGIHGYLTIDVTFNEQLTFITGINGSGKTSALNAIVALISPDLRILANLEFIELTLIFEEKGQERFVSAVWDETAVALFASGSAERFTFKKYVVDLDMPTSRQLDAEVQHYRDLLSANASNEVLRLISALPTPMFLGLDRRARYEDEISKRNRFLYPRAARTTRNLFATSLANSLSDAEDLAATRYRDALIQSGKIAEQLQGELLLGLLSEERGDQRPFGSLMVPTGKDLEDITALRRDLATLSQILRLPEHEVRSRVIPFLDTLEDYASAIPRQTNIAELMKQDTSNSPVMSALFGWSANQNRLKKFNIISHIVSRYNKRRSDLLSPTDRYLSLINSFLKDSGKSINFDDRGYIFVGIKGLEGERSISSLSSGEAQIFVILTHLAFNPLAQNNVFIIDEPELSLHVQWQELFVDSILSSNPNIQYILATHSPSIILERVKCSVDLSKVVEQTPASLRK